MENLKLNDMKASEFIFNPDDNKKLKDYDSGCTGDFKNKKDACESLKEGVALLAELQEKLYAYDKYGMLIILQALDAAGKDGIIKHVLTAVNPQGCQVKSFKAPSAEELDHDFLWRCFKALPERGNIGIFNRSYYEDVLVTRIHPQLLVKAKVPNLPKNPEKSDKFWKTRFQDIVNFEKYLVNNGIVVVKFFLNVSADEQKRRFLERVNNPEKHWKFSPSDLKERGHWDKYQDAYHEIFKHTSTDFAPWYVIPADHKWFTRTAVCEIINNELLKLKLHFPKVSEELKAEIDNAREVLSKEE